MNNVLKITRFDSRLDSLISTEAKLNKLATGYIWSEGPIWDQRDESLYFTDFTPNMIFRWSAAQGVSEYRNDSNRACGLAFDRDGGILCAQTTTRAVTRISRDGSVSVLADSFEGKPLNSPNDVIVRSDGLIFFTDPSVKGTGNENLVGWSGVYCFDVQSERMQLIDKLGWPNGISFSPDERVLYVDDTGEQIIYAYDLAKDGSVSNKRIFAEMDRAYGQGGADGMKLDVHGNMYVTGPGGIWVFAVSQSGGHGEALGIISVGEIAANLCFGGSDRQTLYITAQSSVYAVDVLVAGCRDSSGYYE